MNYRSTLKKKILMHSVKSTGSLVTSVDCGLLCRKPHKLTDQKDFARKLIIRLPTKIKTSSWQLENCGIRDPSVVIIYSTYSSVMQLFFWVHSLYWFLFSAASVALIGWWVVYLRAHMDANCLKQWKALRNCFKMSLPLLIRSILIHDHHRPQGNKSLSLQERKWWNILSETFGLCL